MFIPLHTPPTFESRSHDDQLNVSVVSKPFFLELLPSHTIFFRRGTTVNTGEDNCPSKVTLWFPAPTTLSVCLPWWCLLQRHSARLLAFWSCANHYWIAPLHHHQRLQTTTHSSTQHAGCDDLDIIFILFRLNLTRQPGFVGSSNRMIPPVLFKGKIEG